MLITFILKPEFFSWIKHVANVVKLNVDGAAKSNPSKATSCGIIRDYNGKMIISFCN